MKHNNKWYGWMAFLCCLCLFIGGNSLVRANETGSSLTIKHAHGTVPIHAYRVAYKEGESYIKTEPFADLPIDFSTELFIDSDDVEYFASSNQPRLSSSTANTLYAYIRKQNLEPDYMKDLDENGIGILPGMADGIYLLTSPPYETESQTWYTNPVAIELNPQEHLQLSLKPSLYFTEVETLTIEKVWKSSDGALLITDELPEIEAEVFQDGELYETIKLNAANDWKEELYLSSPLGHWTVIEKNVPEGYTLLVTQDNAQFILTNTKKTASSEDPKDPEDPEDPISPKPDPDPKPVSKPDPDPKPENPINKSDGTISTGQSSGFKFFVALGVVSLFAYQQIRKNRNNKI